MKNKENEKSNKEDGGKSVLPILERIPQGERGEENEETRRTEELKTELKRRSEENVRNARKDSKEISERQLIETSESVYDKTLVIKQEHTANYKNNQPTVTTTTKALKWLCKQQDFTKGIFIKHLIDNSINKFSFVFV